MIDCLTHPTPFVFFTGKGGVGKTSSACATALRLARSGKRVLIVSTDPASNLDAVLATDLGGTPTPIEGAASEAREMDRIRELHAQRVFIAPWSAEDPVGRAALLKLARPERQAEDSARAVMAAEVGT